MFDCVHHDYYRLDHLCLFDFFYQITSWLQGLFVFGIVWSIAGTLDGQSRKKFDEFYRNLITGSDKTHPKPKIIKLSKVNINHFKVLLIAGKSVSLNCIYAIVYKRIGMPSSPCILNPGSCPLGFNINLDISKKWILMDT